jgi:DNA primase
MKAMEKIFDIFDYFEIDNYFDTGELIVMNCPIHEGDNQSAWNVNINKSSEHYGLWFCNTKFCHKSKGHDIISFINLMLDKINNKKHNFVEVLKFIDDFTKDVNINFTKRTVDNFTEIIQKNKKISSHTKFTRNDIRKRLKIPANYYINRNPGFSAETLDKFDVGLCEDINSEMYNRVVFPVYDETNTYFVGCVGRTICENSIKWKNKKGFNKANYLYNYGNAIKEICNSNTLIVVEGQGDVMRLYESGIKNVVGLFGCHLSDSQEFLLQRTGALNIVIMTDNDSAGAECRIDIRSKLKDFYNIYEVIPTKKDIGEMTIKEIDKEIKPKLKGLI